MNRRVWGGKYEITNKNDNYAILECSYCCPYCREEICTLLTVYSVGFDLLEKGNFYEPLTCTYCGKEADVLFG